jgi:hypothetical protein
MDGLRTDMALSLSGRMKEMAICNGMEWDTRNRQYGWLALVRCRCYYYYYHYSTLPTSRCVIELCAAGDSGVCGFFYALRSLRNLVFHLIPYVCVIRKFMNRSVHCDAKDTCCCS